MGRFAQLAKIATAGIVIDYALLAYIVRNDEVKCELPQLKKNCN